MQPYRVVDDDFEDESYPRVVPITAAPRARARAGERAGARREPWTPRDDDIVPRTVRTEAPPARERPRRPPASETYILMVGVFLAVAVGMIVAMVAWRIWWQAPARTASVGNPAGQQAAPPPPPPVEQPTPEPPPTGTGPIVSDIKVIQPNYTVAPGDTLGSIARRHGTTVEALASLNNLENRNALAVGQRLIVPQP